MDVSKLYNTHHSMMLLFMTFTLKSHKDDFLQYTL